MVGFFLNLVSLCLCMHRFSILFPVYTNLIIHSFNFCLVFFFFCPFCVGTDWCARNFLDMLHEFLSNTSIQFCRSLALAHILRQHTMCAGSLRFCVQYQRAIWNVVENVLCGSELLFFIIVECQRLIENNIKCTKRAHTLSLPKCCQRFFECVCAKRYFIISSSQRKTKDHLLHSIPPFFACMDFVFVSLCNDDCIIIVNLFSLFVPSAFFRAGDFSSRRDVFVRKKER